MKLAAPARLILVSVTPPWGFNREGAKSCPSRATRIPVSSRVRAASCAAAYRAVSP